MTENSSSDPGSSSSSTTDKKKSRTTTRRRHNPEGQMPLKAHLTELRNRIIKAGLALVAGTIVGFILYQPTFTMITEPVSRLDTAEHPAEVVFSSVAQPFDIMLQVALFTGVVISSPIWLYQLWAFIMPGLKKNEKIYTLGFLAAAIPLFIGGVVLGWVALPQALSFFTSLTPEGTAHRIQATVYIPFVLRLLLVFGVALVLPVILVGLNMAGVISGKQILKQWRISVIVIAVVAAMAAPGSDVITMFFMGLPLTILFFVALVICLVNDKRRAKRQAKKQRQLDEEIQRGARPLGEL
ncbi:twin-arginine translocase subunit TatC [Auritidibacter ignavus]|uniref:twin-arginine translocase subunit TatC n=1 Tax=Auritidibacter ignavus TaxID=678932 RepID=UPI0021033FC3|nr:twin-arginine translocase subunit TatC [Auritidibacter ignavus]